MASLYTPPGFSGVIGNTPTGAEYKIAPGQTITVSDGDVQFLLARGFSVAAPSAQTSLTVQDNATGTVAAVSIINFSGAVITAGGAGTANVVITAGTATVRSVDVSGGNTGLTTSGGPVTGAGTITIAGTLSTANGGTGLASLTGLMALQNAGTVAITGGSITGMAAPSSATDVANKTYVDANTTGRTIAATSLFGNSATAAGTMAAISLGTNLSITGTTLNAAVTTISADHGALINSGTVQVEQSVTLAGTAGGTLTIAPGSGTKISVVNLAANGGTQTLAYAGAYNFQSSRIHIKQGATVSSVVLNTGTVGGFIFGSSGSPTSYTVTAVVGAIDEIGIEGPTTAYARVVAIAQGFTA